MNVPKWGSLETFSFGDGPALAQELAELVLSGKKTATCWPAAEGLASEIGKRMIMLDGAGRPRAILETIELRRRRFDEVDAAFAFDEGEVDRTLDYWRQAHQRYFIRNRTFAPEMELWCERFRVVTTLDGSSA